MWGVGGVAGENGTRPEGSARRGESGGWASRKRESRRRSKKKRKKMQGKKAREVTRGLVEQINQRRRGEKLK
jgi:hypothetical protein